MVNMKYLHSTAVLNPTHSRTGVGSTDDATSSNRWLDEAECRDGNIPSAVAGTEEGWTDDGSCSDRWIDAAQDRDGGIPSAVADGSTDATSRDWWLDAAGPGLAAAILLRLTSAVDWVGSIGCLSLNVIIQCVSSILNSDLKSIHYYLSLLQQEWNDPQLPPLWVQVFILYNIPHTYQKFRR